MGGLAKKQKETFQKKEKEKSPRNRLERLRSRMSSYRERSKIMEERQSLKTPAREVSNNGFNLFCREVAPAASALQVPDLSDVKDYRDEWEDTRNLRDDTHDRNAIMNFDEDLLDRGLGDSDETGGRGEYFAKSGTRI